MKHIALLCAVAPFLIGLASCASTSNETKIRGIAAFEGDPRLGKKVDKICFQRNIDGFSETTNDTVVLSAGVNKDYIVSVNGACRNLDYARSVGVLPRTSCLTRNDVLLVSQSAFTLNDRNSLGPDRCFVDEIYKWDKRAEAEKDMAANVME